MTYYAGIDGGQSSTTAVIADERGRILGRGTAGPSDEVGQGFDSTRLRDALRAALSDAVKRGGLPENTRFSAVVAGISGYEGRVHGQAPELPAATQQFVHDSENAHAGALGGEAGVVVIAGTGSIGFARTGNGMTALVGGWGFLFGDEGSAFWLARTALADAMRNADVGEPNELGSRALEYFQVPTLRQISRGFYLERISRARLASFAQIVIDSAQRGNELAVRYVRDGAASLVMLAVHAMRQAGMSDAKVAFAGGLMQSATYREQIANQMKRIAPHAQLVEPRYDAAVGALILAYKECGISVPESIA